MTAALDRMAGHPEIQRMRAAALAVFAPAPGERLLDAGCGAGEVARQLGARVGGAGSVVAMDKSAGVVALAESRHDTGPVTYQVGDVLALDFPDGHFDGVRAERVLQHLHDPDRAIAELLRVTRPGGRVCVIDTDWSSAVCEGVAGQEALAALQRTNRHPQPDIGRTVRFRMITAGLTAVTTFPVTLCFTTPEDAAGLTAVFIRRVMRDILSPERFESFFAEVDRAAERGEFLYAFTMWITQGRVPVR